MNANKRLDAIEDAVKPKKGRRVFLVRDGAYSEGYEPRTRQDVDDAELQGFDVLIIEVVRDR